MEPQRFQETKKRLTFIEENDQLPFHGNVTFSPSVHGHSCTANTLAIKHQAMEAQIFSCVLKDSVDKLKILGLLKHIPGNQKTAMKYRTLKDMFHHGKMTEFIFDKHTMEPMFNVQDQSNLAQYKMVRALTEELLTIAQKDLRNHMRVDKFVEELNRYKTSEEEKQALLAEAKENAATIRRLSTQIDSERATMMEKLQEKSDILGKLKDDYEDTYYENKIKQRYVEAWENARCYQNSFLLAQKQSALHKSLHTARHNFRRENKIHTTIRSFMEIWRTDILDDIERWMQLYDTDMEKIGLQIGELKGTLEQLRDEFTVTFEDFERRRKDVDGYLAQRKVREEEERIFQEKTKAATKIQAWWRGTMFRHCLGPYRKKKGKKNKGNKGQPKKRKS